VALAEAGRGGGASLLATREVGLELTDEGAERPPQLDGPPDGVAMPERQLARDARCGTDRDPVVADLLDPPAARAQDHDVAVHPGPQLVDHLLVELSHAAARRARLADHEHAVQTSVGDRPAAGDRHDAGIAATLHDVGQAVPHDPRLELGELVRRVGAGEHPEHAFEHVAGQGLVRSRRGDRGQQLVDGPLVHHGHGDELLGENVERVARDHRGLDRAFVHPPGDDGALEQVAAVLREDHPLAGSPDLVAGATDPLEPTGDARRALDLDDEVDRAHVDAQLEAGGGDQRREPAGLELLLDLEPLLAGDAPVVRPDELLAGELVQALRQPLAQAAGVGEDDGAAVAPDQFEDPRMDRRPDAGSQVRSGGRAAGLLVGRQDLTHRRHVVDRDNHLELERLARTRVHDPDVAPGTDTGHEPGDRLERSLRGGQADPLGWLGVRGAESLQPLEAQREMRTALGAGDGVDLVDDHVLHAAEDLARAAGQHQVERFGGRDQDVRGVARDLPSILGRGVSRPRGDRDAGWWFAEPLRREADPGEGRLEVALDVVGEGLERRDIQDADLGELAFDRRWTWVAGQPVQAPQEGREGLAAAGRGVDQRVPTLRDRLPPSDLGRRGRLEDVREPAPDRRRESLQGRMDCR
jgi:hypothetical protein